MMNNDELEKAIEEGQTPFLFADRSKMVSYKPPWSLIQKYFFKYWSLWIVTIIIGLVFIYWGLGTVSHLTLQSPLRDVVGSFVSAAFAVILLFVLIILRIGSFFYNPLTNYLFSNLDGWIGETIHCPACNGKVKNQEFETRLFIPGGLFYCCDVKCSECGRIFVFKEMLGWFILTDEKKNLIQVEK